MSQLDNMNLADLRVFVAVARSPSLALAADTVHLTPSAISKALRRLEESLGIVLFDRSARGLALNDDGRRLLDRAQPLLALAEQTRSDLMGQRAHIHCRLGGPAILLQRHAAKAARVLEGLPHATLELRPAFEDHALASLARGDINCAIVTGAVADPGAPHWNPGWERHPLGSLDLRLVAQREHPLARAAQRGPVTLQEVLAHAFACPTRSLFCGVERGPRSDGWRDEADARHIRYWTDDLHLLLGLVKNGLALAYLPEWALDDPALVQIDTNETALGCSEEVWIVWNGTSAPQWLAALATSLGQGQA